MVVIGAEPGLANPVVARSHRVHECTTYGIPRGVRVEPGLTPVGVIPRPKLDPVCRREVDIAVVEEHDVGRQNAEDPTGQRRHRAGRARYDDDRAGRRVEMCVDQKALARVVERHERADVAGWSSVLSEIDGAMTPRVGDAIPRREVKRPGWESGRYGCDVVRDGEYVARVVHHVFAERLVLVGEIAGLDGDMVGAQNFAQRVLGCLSC